MPLTHPALRPVFANKRSGGSATYILDFLKDAHAIIDNVKDRKPEVFFKEVGAELAELSVMKRDETQVKAFVNVVLTKDYTKFPAECRHALGFFLVEVMRLCNLTLHDSNALKKFKDTFATIKIEWKGHPDRCIERATFSSLEYVEADGGYVKARFDE